MRRLRRRNHEWAEEWIGCLSRFKLIRLRRISLATLRMDGRRDGRDGLHHQREKLRPRTHRHRSRTWHRRGLDRDQHHPDGPPFPSPRLAVPDHGNQRPTNSDNRLERRRRRSRRRLGATTRGVPRLRRPHPLPLPHPRPRGPRDDGHHQRHLSRASHASEAPESGRRESCRARPKPEVFGQPGHTPRALGSVGPRSVLMKLRWTSHEVEPRGPARGLSHRRWGHGDLRILDPMDTSGAERGRSRGLRPVGTTLLRSVAWTQPQSSRHGTAAAYFSFRQGRPTADERPANISSQSPPNDRGKWRPLTVTGGQSEHSKNALCMALYQVISPGREPICRAPPVGIEPTTCGLGNRRSIH